MKYLIALFFLSISIISKAQTQDIWRDGIPLKQVVDNSTLIFEGKILTDSVYFQNSPGEIATYHHVLVLKKFKGDFKSDTLSITNFGGEMKLKGIWEGGDRPSYAHTGDEAIFFVNNYWSKDFYNIGYGAGVGFVTVCDKKDVVKEVYERVEGVTGQPYIEVHPNNCNGQLK